ncbi:MAG: hypothetical protein ACI9CV_001203 [Ilumatobacter sp.]|jgi:hypothetical protein
MIQRVVTMFVPSCRTVGIELALHGEFKNFGHLTSSLRAAAGGVHGNSTVVVRDACGALVLLKLLVVERPVGVSAVNEMVDDVVLELLSLFEQYRDEISELVTGTRVGGCGREPVDLIDTDPPGEKRVTNSSVVVDEVGATPDPVGMDTRTVQDAFEVGPIDRCPPSRNEPRADTTATAAARRVAAAR